MLYDTSRLYDEVTESCLHCGYNPDEGRNGHTSDCPVGVVEGLHLLVSMRRPKRLGGEDWESVGVGAFRDLERAKEGISRWLRENTRSPTSKPQPNYRNPCFDKVMLVGQVEPTVDTTLWDHTKGVIEDQERRYGEWVQELGRRDRLARCRADLEDLRSREWELRPEIYRDRLTKLEAEEASLSPPPKRVPTT